MVIRRKYAIWKFKSGKEEKGKEILRRCADRGDRKAAVILSEMLAEEGEMVQAVEVLRKAAVAGEIDIALPLADLLSEVEGAAGEAERWYRVAVDGGTAGALNNFGAFLSQFDSRKSEAEELLGRAAEAGDSLAVGNLGKMYMDDADYEKSLPWLQKSLDFGNIQILPYLARAEVEMGDREIAWSHILEALEEGGGEAYLAFSVYLDKYGDLHPELDIEDSFARSLESGPEASLLFGNWLKEQGRFEEAERQYRIAVEGGEGNSLQNLALVLHLLGKSEEAEKSFRAAVRNGDSLAAVNYVRFLADEGRIGEIPNAIRNAESVGCEGGEIRNLWIMYNSLK